MALLTCDDIEYCNIVHYRIIVFFNLFIARSPHNLVSLVMNLDNMANYNPPLRETFLQFYPCLI